MIDIYNPIGAVEIFAEVLRRYPKTRLKMNAAGDLRAQVKKRIEELGIESSVEFLDNIKTWEELSSVYASCDIMFLPAKFSNGNYTIVECRASGMGCIISDKVLGVYGSQIIAAGAGFVLPLDKQLFVDKICWYIQNPEVFEKEALVNREQLRYLTHEETARMYAALLKDL
jgi:glycosyltransferase involved in cell wall biosynthesis